MTSVPRGAKVPCIEKDRPANRRNSVRAGSIHSANVVLVEGNADEFVPNVEAATGMHGFAIMVPASEGENWLLDMLWRVTIAYAGFPSLLRSRSKVQKMVEAVMNYKSRPVKGAKPKPRK